jgi:hypothetical protein
MNRQSEFDNFDATMRKLIRVPHSKIKAKLEAEKKEKQTKREPKPSDNHSR